MARTGDYYSRENDDDYLEPEWFGGDLLMIQDRQDVPTVTLRRQVPLGEICGDGEGEEEQIDGGGDSREVVFHGLLDVGLLS